VRSECEEHSNITLVLFLVHFQDSDYNGRIFVVNQLSQNIKHMKHIATLLILFSLSNFSIAQKVYSVKYSSQADIKVYVVNYESQCDLKVYKVNYESQANSHGKWFFVNYESQADKKIYFVDYESQADLKIYFVNYESQAGWKNKNKQHLLY
jgi:hypothetical protein